MNMNNNLKKSLESDTVGSLFVLICSGYMVLGNLFTLIVEFGNIPYRGDNNAHEFAYLLKQQVFYIILFIVLILINKILLEIKNTGKPFSKSIIKSLEMMSGIVMLAGVLPEAVSLFAGIIDKTVLEKGFTFDYDNIFQIIIGFVIAFIARIFKYGYELQSDMDQIA